MWMMTSEYEDKLFPSLELQNQHFIVILIQIWQSRETLHKQKEAANIG